MDAFWWRILGLVALSGLIVSLLNIRKAIFLGMSVSMLVICFMFVISLSERTETGWQLLSAIILTCGNLVAFFILVSFYTFYCLLKNQEYISEGSMPDSWYLFSYFVVILTALNIFTTIQYLNNDASANMYNALSMLLNTILLGFILIETIICSYFRTDGFTL